jgi:hypothetical protein
MYVTDWVCKGCAIKRRAANKDMNGIEGLRDWEIEGLGD